MRDYIEYNRQHNLFFDEENDEELIKFKEKLERKKANVAECEKRLEELVKRKNNGEQEHYASNQGAQSRYNQERE